MRLIDKLTFSFQLYTRQRFKTVMTLLAVSIGVMSVVLLTGLSDGARQYVLREFSLLGKETLVVLPGRKETEGGIPPLTGEGTRDLTLEDAKALYQLSDVKEVIPIIAGLTQGNANGLSRELMVMGANNFLLPLFGIPIRLGHNLPESDLASYDPIAVIGDQVAKDLFPNKSPLGEWLKLGDRRFRIIGVLEPAGINFGTNMSDIVLIPVVSAQSLFNTPGLFRMIIKLKSEEVIEPTKIAVENLIAARHAGERDITLVTQDALLKSFEKIIHTFTLVVLAVATISLVVAGILIMNITLISVSQRVPEIGLLKALGASQQTVLSLFLLDALLITLFGAIAGLALGVIGLTIIHQLWPTFPFSAPIYALAGAIALALTLATLFAWLPARQASRIDPVNALRGQVHAD